MASSKWPIMYTPNILMVPTLLRFLGLMFDSLISSMPFEIVYIMMTSSNGNIFRVTGPLCGEFTGPGEFPAQKPVTRSFVIFFDLRLNKWLSKQSWGWWFETLSCSLWRHFNVYKDFRDVLMAVMYTRRIRLNGKPYSTKYYNTTTTKWRTINRFRIICGIRYITLRLRQNGRYFKCDIFKYLNEIFKRKCTNLDWNFTEMFS